MKTYKLRRAAVSLLSSAMLMLSPLTVFANTTNDTTLVNSGDHVDIDTRATTRTDVDVTNNNTANIAQIVKADSNTGNNDANRNIGGGTVNTGTANVGVTMNATANKNLTAISGLQSGNSTNTTDVVNTGDHVDVDTSTRTVTDVDVTNRNSAHVFQKVYADADTGNNDANRNIGGGTVNTGTANVGVTMNTDVNKNATYVGGLGGNGGGNLTNDTSVVNTGDHLDVDSTVRSRTDIDVRNSNYASIYQLLFGHANTGYNDANRNIGGGTVNTGTANVGATMNANANTNLTGIGLYSGNLSNLFDVVNTGDHLDGDTILRSTVDVDTRNNNRIRLLQLEFAHSNSGYNDARRDIFGGTVNAGGANTGTTFNSSSNYNATFVGSLGGLLLSFLGFI